MGTIKETIFNIFESRVCVIFMAVSAHDSHDVHAAIVTSYRSEFVLFVNRVTASCD